MRLAPSFLAGRLRPPGLLRVAPIDALKEAGGLRCGQRNDPFRRRRPDEAPPVQPLGVERQPKSVMPKTLDQRTGPAAENEDISGERITLEMLLHQQREAWHALAHIRVARGDPNPNPTRDRDHRSARSAALTIDTVAAAPIVTRAPLASSTTIAGSDRAAHSASRCPSTITAGTNWPSARAAMTSRRHL